MVKPRLRTPKDGSKSGSEPEAEARPIPLRPLNVSGVVISKKELVAALKIYVPALVDVQAFEDGEQFYLILGADGSKESGPDLAAD